MSHRRPRIPLPVRFLFPLATAAPLLPALLGVIRPERDSRDRPNLLVLSIDTLRADHLGSYGYGRDTSPALDALAARSVRFETCGHPLPGPSPPTPGC